MVMIKPFNLYFHMWSTNPLQNAFMRPENLDMVAVEIQRRLTERSVPMWTLLEEQWQRGHIPKPVIVPADPRSFMQFASSQLDDIIVDTSPEALLRFNENVVAREVEDLMSGARERFYSERSRLKDHPVYFKRPEMLRERPRGIFNPLSTGEYALRTPSASLYMKSYKEAYDRL